MTFGVSILTLAKSTTWRKAYDAICTKIPAIVNGVQDKWRHLSIGYSMGCCTVFCGFGYDSQLQKKRFAGKDVRIRLVHMCTNRLRCSATNADVPR